MVGRRRKREVLIRVAGVALRARLLDTPAAEHVWQALPIYAPAESRLGAILFGELPGGMAGTVGSIRLGSFGLEGDTSKIVIPYGAAHPPSLGYVWARAIDDVSALAAVREGEPVALLEADS